MGAGPKMLFAATIFDAVLDTGAAYAYELRLATTVPKAVAIPKKRQKGRKYRNFLIVSPLWKIPHVSPCCTVIFSLIETAEEHGLDPYSYLSFVLKETPKLRARDSDGAVKLTPEYAPVWCVPKNEH